VSTSPSAVVDSLFQLITPSANITIYVATAGAILGDNFIIKNNVAFGSGLYIDIDQVAGNRLTRLYQGSISRIIFDGTNWTAFSVGSGDNEANKAGQTALGKDARASQSNTTAIGNNTTASLPSTSAFGSLALANGTESTALGYSSDAGGSQSIAVGDANASSTGSIAIGSEAQSLNPRSIAIGREALSENDDAIAIGTQAIANGLESIAIGNTANADSAYSIAIGSSTQAVHNHSIALGSWSVPDNPYTEFTTNTEGTDSNDYGYGRTNWRIATANADSTELLLGGEAANRWIIPANSCIAFDITINVRDDTSNDCAYYNIKVGIKRDGSNNTSLVGTYIKTVIGEDDASWDVGVDADDTNESLTIWCKLDATNACRINAAATFSKVAF